MHISRRVIRALPAMLCFAWVCSLLAPLVLLMRMSLGRRDFRGGVLPGFSSEGWSDLAGPAALSSVIESAWYGLATVAICALISLPLCLALFHASNAWRRRLLATLLFPLSLNSLLIAFNWQTMLANTGFVNSALMDLGVIEQPLPMLFRPPAVLAGMVGSYLPIFLLPVLTVTARIDRGFAQASAMLGAGPFQTFFRVILPLSKNGFLVGALLVYLPCCSEFLLPDLLGGGKIMLLGSLLQFWFYEGRNWPAAAALSLILIAAGGLLAAFLLRLIKNAIVVDRP